MTDYENFLDMIGRAGYRFEAMEDIDDEGICNKFIAFEDKEKENTILAAQFTEEGTFVEIYIADACETLEDFMNS